MPFATWWRGDPLPVLPPLPAFSVHIAHDTQLIARLNNLSQRGIHTRLQGGNRPYIAYLDTSPVAYGWLATREGGIIELQFSFKIPARNCYLWDFLTLPAWRGRGIYPHFLHAIIHQEQLFERFWIAYEPGNEASARAIDRAGLRLVSEMVFAGGRVAGLTLFDDSQYARASASFFDLPVMGGQ